MDSWTTSQSLLQYYSRELMQHHSKNSKNKDYTIIPNRFHTLATATLTDWKSSNQTTGIYLPDTKTLPASCSSLIRPICRPKWEFINVIGGFGIISTFFLFSMEIVIYISPPTNPPLLNLWTGCSHDRCTEIRSKVHHGKNYAIQ